MLNFGGFFLGKKYYRKWLPEAAACRKRAFCVRPLPRPLPRWGLRHVSQDTAPSGPWWAWSPWGRIGAGDVPCLTTGPWDCTRKAPPVVSVSVDLRNVRSLVPRETFKRGFV